MKPPNIRTCLNHDTQWLSLQKRRYQLPVHRPKGLLYYANIFLYLLVTLSGQVALAAPKVEPEGEKGEGVFVPGSPVTNESVEAGLLKIRHALRASPGFQENDAPTHLRLAEVLSQQGDPNGAIEEYQATIQLNADSAEAYRGLGAVFIDTHKWRNAEEALQTSARLDSTDSQTFYWLGRTLMAQYNFSGATAAFTTATVLNPQDAESFADLGLVQMAQGHASDAGKALTQAIQLRPEFAEAHHRLELLRASKQDPQQLTRAALEMLNILFRRE